ncbi:MAG TPA: glycosyltransferase family 39 protein, partial [Victivallales bacterium]|nr:glycosyltransferase family 39 protein [Victivallales bacterium]
MILHEKKTYVGVAVLLLSIHFILSSLAIFAKSPTFDESVHLSGGYTYWKLNDYRINPENGNFPQRWAALPLLIKNNITLPLESEYWKNSKQWFFSYIFIFKSGNDHESLFRLSKFNMILLSLALCSSVFFISKKIFGIRGAMISLALCALSPTILAHSNLVTSDMSSALFFLLSIFFLWENLRKINLSNTILCSLSLSFLFLSKMSAPLIIPLYLIIILIRLRSPESIVCEFRNKKKLLDNSASKIKGIAVLVLIHTLSVFVTIWAAYGFRYHPVPAGSPSAGKVAMEWNELLKDNDSLEKIIITMDKFRALPRAYLHGFLYVKKHLGKRLAFMNGEKSKDGFALFFPYCFLVKTPIPSLLMMIASVFIITGLGRRPKDIAPFVIFTLIFVSVALTSSINIGHRHLLPLYPIIFIFCGVLGTNSQNKDTSFKRNSFVLTCIVWLAFEAVASAPNHLSYFNQIVGGSGKGYLHLADSSIDWGQDLKDVKKLRDKLDPEHNELFHIAYFGTASINSYGLKDFISLPGFFTQE